MEQKAPSFEQTLVEVESQFGPEIERAPDEQSLRQVQARYLGRSGLLTAALREMGKIAANERKAAGARVNALKQRIETAFAERLAQIQRELRRAELAAPPFDLSLPGRAPTRGHLHPTTRMREDMLEVFRGLGFAVVEGPQVELESYNFTKLGFPPDHPAMDMHDTFWVQPGPGAPGGFACDGRVLLRTHTSPVQVREMLAHAPPLAVVSAGPCYRCDEDATHTPMFHQMEGFMVGEGLSFAHLKGVLAAFVHRLFGERVVRFRPSYFPFVEPGTEVDMSCAFCQGTGCRTCKGTGFMEILGAGMIHPVVLEHCGIDPERWSGFAFGTGIERPAMQKYGIPHLGMMFENDVRFLAQFP